MAPHTTSADVTVVDPGDTIVAIDPETMAITLRNGTVLECDDSAFAG